MTIPYITPAPYNPSPRHSRDPSRHSREGGNPAASLHHVMLHNPSHHSRVGGNPTPSLIQNVSASGTEPDAVDNSEL